MNADEYRAYVAKLKASKARLGPDTCPNCGDRFRMTKNAVAERAKLGWCSGCWSQKVHAQYGTNKHTGEASWVNGGRVSVGRRWAGRPEYDRGTTDDE